MTVPDPARDSARAAIRAVLAAVDEAAITEAEAVRRVSADQVRAVLRPVLAADADFGAVLAAIGTAASPGAAAGIAVGTQGEAREEPGAILVRPWTGPQDMHGMIAAVAVVTEEGSSACHAATLSRAFDIPCVTGCGPGTLEALDGQEITVDGDTGRIWVGELPVCVTDEATDGDLRRLTGWARSVSPVIVVSPAGEAPGPVFDASTIPAEDLDENLPAIPPGTRTVAGGMFCTRDGIHAALDAGVEVIMAECQLPVLLTAIAYAGH
jgi:pyruvate,orthophosphate dikinase